MPDISEVDAAIGEMHPYLASNRLIAFTLIILKTS